MPISRTINACLKLTRAISGTQTSDEIYQAALDALTDGLHVQRASILLFDSAGVMRFVAWRGLSETYRSVVEGHTPWEPGTGVAAPIVVEDVRRDPSLTSFLPALEAEGIGALAFIPLVSLGRLIGKFMLYYPEPTVLSPERLDLAGVIAAQVSFALERTQAKEVARVAAARLEFALDAACMGTWDWDLVHNTVVWSNNLERIHGLPAGSFDGTFESYQREIHPDDRAQVEASIARALSGTGEHEVEYRLVAPDGTIRWAEGKGRVEFQDGQPVRMSGVCMIVTRRKEAELAKLETAHELARSKDEFLAVLSHELRTPLNAVLGWLQMLESGATPPGQVAEALKIIRRNAQLQAQLIEDILDVSRIISGSVNIRREPVAVLSLLENAVAAVLPAARDKGIELATELPGVLPTVSGDAPRLQQVLGNVLANAVKFTEAGGRIMVRAAADDGVAIIDVIDTGEGIPVEFIPFVFERFRQADSRSTRRHGGLGLGLAIARHFVELHGGAITAFSAGPGLGTTINLRLPVATVLVDGPPAVLSLSDSTSLATDVAPVTG